MDRAGTLRVVLGDQCSPRLSALEDLDPAHDVVLMAEVHAECTYVRHHPKKISLVLSAMRHFARALGSRGVRVRYVQLDDPDNTHSLRGEVVRAATELSPGLIVATEPGEWRVLDDMLGWEREAGCRVEIRDDTRFLCSRQEFRAWARSHSQLRMEFFYRAMRRRYRLLMDSDGQPTGGRWNLDKENRKPLPKTLAGPPVPRFGPDEITVGVMRLVQQRFPDHFGTLDGFRFAVTGRDARLALQDFIVNRLPGFGDWQDTMKAGEPTLYHALVSTSLNLGLLDPLEVCQAAEDAYRAGAVPLNGAEGFIRQILGWREYVRGIYWLHMPEYARRNALEARRGLPPFYWTGETGMNCLHHAVTETRDNAYAHHIQRLMVTGNFALIAGIDPDEVDEWYLIVYADAYQWVEMPNVRGMALHGDGGVMGSKPYAASGAYINRMSDYCQGCRYDVRESTTENACPFNALYWDFLARHEERFAANPRMAMPLGNWQRMAPERRAALRARAAAFLDRMDAGKPV